MLQREQNKLFLFDVDGTLSLARQPASPQVLQLLQQLRQKVAIGFVGGSDLPKIQEQLGPNAVDAFDFAFAENGLVAFKMSKPIETQSFISFIGEERYKTLVNYILRYLSELDLPIKRGTFIEFRNGLINVSPIGRNTTIKERVEFEAYDKIHHLREAFVLDLERQFNTYNLKFAIGGQISFDVFPIGWDKTYCLKLVEDDAFDEIHFFGDKTYKGGNDYEIFQDQRTIGHSVTCPEDTIRILQQMFSLE